MHSHYLLLFIEQYLICAHFVLDVKPPNGYIVEN